MSRQQAFWTLVGVDFLTFFVLVGLFHSFGNPFIDTTLSLLCVIAPFAWIATDHRTAAYFVPDTYVHPVKAVLVSLLLVSLCVVVARLPYSLTVLGLVLWIWLSIALWSRRLARRLMNPIRCVALGAIDTELEAASQTTWIHPQKPQNVCFETCDVLVYQEGSMLAEEWRKLILHAQVVGTPIISDQLLVETLFGRVAVEHVQASWLPGSFVFHKAHLILKRVIDVVTVLICAPLLCIVSIMVIILIWLKMGWPICFCQSRVGKEGKYFTLYKFRTMTVGAEQQGELYSESDARITRLGRVLRKFRLDELPQCWNVLRGDMSLIGPRPEWTKTAQRYAEVIPLYSLRHLVKPGITGWAQVHQGYAVGVAETNIKLRYDLFYVKHFSLWLDLVIALRTVWVVLSGYRAR